MDMKQLLILGLQISVVLTVFGYGLRTTAGDLLYVVKRPGLAARSLLSVFVIMPVIAFALARLFDIRDVVEISLVALAISPVPPLLPMKEIKSGGQASYGLGLMALLALLAIPAAPLAIELLERFSGQPLEISASAIARLAMISVLVPLAAGVIVRVVAPVIAERIGGAVSQVAKVLLLVAACVLLAAVWRAVWNATGQGAILAIVVFVAAGLAIGHLLGGPKREESVVLGLSTACRHPAIAFAIASANYPEERFGGAIILYLLVSALVGIPYVKWNRQRGDGSSDQFADANSLHSF
jgi:BASS family bile acid:Na+ symporter